MLIVSAYLIGRQPNIKINISYRDIIVKQSCYFAKVCDREINKKAIRGQLIFIATLCTRIKV